MGLLDCKWIPFLFLVDFPLQWMAGSSDIG